MNPKLDAGLAERLWLVGFMARYDYKPTNRLSRLKEHGVRREYNAVANEVRKIVKEAKEGE